MKRLAIAASPLGLIALCRFAQQLGGTRLGAWAVIPTMFLFWTSIATLVAWSGTRPAAWLGRPRGAWGWSALAIVMGLLSAGEIVHGYRVLASPGIVALWLVFGLVNPWFEEAYWRGLLIDATRRWPLGLGVVYAATLFALSHPWIWGVHAPSLRDPRALVGLGLVGFAWGVVYARTGSLRFTILGHACANLLGLSVPVLLNLYTPAALR